MTGILPINTGTCEPWATADDLLACCDETIGSDTALAEQAAQLASDLLYELTGHAYPGICTGLVRPGGRDLCWIPPRFWSRWSGGSRQASITLGGYPVREILEVQIDGAALDPADYELQRNRYLVRIDGGRWPTRPPGGDNTFTVEYLYGLEPPLAGVLAATELGCEVLKAGCAGGDTGECDLPAGMVRMTRQGITIDTQQLGLWLIGTMRSGMPLVDAFLSSYGTGRKRRTALYSPELDPYPLRVE